MHDRMDDVTGEDGFRRYSPSIPLFAFSSKDDFHLLKSFSKIHDMAIFAKKPPPVEPEIRGIC